MGAHLRHRSAMDIDYMKCSLPTFRLVHACHRIQHRRVNARTAWALIELPDPSTGRNSSISSRTPSVIVTRDTLALMTMTNPKHTTAARRGPRHTRAGVHPRTRPGGSQEFVMGCRVRDHLLAFVNVRPITPTCPRNRPRLFSLAQPLKSPVAAAGSIRTDHPDQPRRYVIARLTDYAEAQGGHRLAAAAVRRRTPPHRANGGTMACTPENDHYKF